MCLKTMKKVDDKGKEKEHNGKLTRNLEMRLLILHATRVEHAAPACSILKCTSICQKFKEGSELLYTINGRLGCFDVSPSCLVRISKVIMDHSKYQVRSSLSTCQ